MDHTEIEEQQIVDRYVMGKLPAAEAERFEEHYLSCPQCLDQLDLAESVQRGFKRAAGQDVARVAVTRQLALVAWLTRLGRSRQLAVLAMAVFVVALLPVGLSFREIGERNRELAQARSALQQAGERSVAGSKSAAEAEKLRAELEASRRDLAREREDHAKSVEQLAQARQPQGNVPILSLNTERGSSSSEPSVHLRLPSAPSWFVFSLGIDPPYQPSYRVILRDARGRELWHGDGLRFDDGWLNLSLHSSMLAPGDYTLAVESLVPGRKPVVAGRFAFRALPSA